MVSDLNVLCKSPLQISDRLHPACFANACNIWSKKPIPELMLIVWLLLACEACPSVPLRSLLSVVEGNSPPSRFIARTIFVSLVSRASAAERTRWSNWEPIVVLLTFLQRGSQWMFLASQTGAGETKIPPLLHDVLASREL